MLVATADQIDRKIAAPGTDDAIPIGAVGIEVDRSQEIGPKFRLSPKGAIRAYRRLEMSQQDCFDCAHYRRQKQNNQGTKMENAPAQAYVVACVIAPMLRK